jgi:predicted ATPase
VGWLTICCGRSLRGCSPRFARILAFRASLSKPLQVGPNFAQHVAPNIVAPKIFSVWGQIKKDLNFMGLRKFNGQNPRGIKMKIYDVRYPPRIPWNAEIPCLILVKDGWNDFGYTTLYKLYFADSNRVLVDIGHVKILNQDQSGTVVPDIFETLDESFCSLGQEMNYYKNFRKYLSEEAESILSNLKDVSINKNAYQTFKEHVGFSKSLLRSSEAEKAFHEGVEIIRGISREYKHNFEFDFQLHRFSGRHVFQVDFDPTSEIPARVVCLIGKNGTGKTQFLSRLAVGLSGQSENKIGSFSPGRPLFSKVIAVSYSSFDAFSIPKNTKQFNYKYCGIKNSDNSLNVIENVQSNIVSDVEDIKSKNLETHWKGLLEESIDATILDSIIQQPNKIKDERFSSGQMILLRFATDVLSFIDEDSLILFDEPEMHLHPNAITTLIKMIYKIVDEFKSYAILATHSPIILQQVPSKSVRVVNVVDSVPIVTTLETESFGENLSVLTKNVFGNTEEVEYYKEFIQTIAKNHPFTSLDDLFGDKISASLSLFIRSLKT